MTEDTDESPRLSLIGDQFPELEVTTTHGEKTLPDDYAGEWFILFSHPGDFTPVCTSEFVAFEQAREQFEDMNTKLIGLSVDRIHSHIKWTEWIDDELDVDIGFPIIADESGRVGERLGMIQPNAGTSTVRAVFIVDDTATIRTILYYPAEVGRNIDEVLRAVEALQTSDENEVATPANWPENDTFGDQVLLPPPGTEADAEARLEEAEEKGYDARDWWFTLRDL
ncbi:peroxiredoxin [Halanaeroarchaeum sulfurireducens]|uniref:Peroxiredoxin n=1 Tax=Halanaeroarchaeum sulfurireducens TaxID=1604004 RepID=A0A0F7PC60_9EURY|nr:peroxiredoxin [Halanaeroarchaeum sulfurireducens]AKH97755.1 peroxiredoxin [Halanaeroarchaeum sulfurireducens]ALG82150.1 peroxiredoxin [Halanaeroarchaeum sulfurireducens]